MTTRKELVEALRLRYRGAAFSDRINTLGGFVAVTRCCGKHAIHVLRVGAARSFARTIFNRQVADASRYARSTALIRV